MTEINIKIKKVKSVLKSQFNEIKNLSGINSLLLSVCLIDTIAGFYCGYNGEKGGNKKRYSIFVENYLPKYNAELYDIRCNLTHSFSNTISNFIFIDNKEYTNIFDYATNIIGQKTFDINLFKNDLENAINKYFEELENFKDEAIVLNFIKRFNKLNILDDGHVGFIRNLKGDLIKKYDELDSLPGLDLKICLASPIKIKK